MCKICVHNKLCAKLVMDVEKIKMGGNIKEKTNTSKVHINCIPVCHSLQSSPAIYIVSQAGALVYWNLAD